MEVVQFSLRQAYNRSHKLQSKKKRQTLQNSEHVNRTNFELY